MKPGYLILIPLLFRNGTTLNECERCKCCKSNRCWYNHAVSDYCWDGCLDGYFGDRCVHACMNNCQTCSNRQSCTKCSDGFYGDRCMNTCIKKCKTCSNAISCTKCSDGFYGEYCSKCPDNCTTCSGLNSCNSCKDGFYNGRENDNNLEAIYFDCRHHCKDNCKSCTSYNTCTACKDGWYNYNYNDCREKCHSACKACISYSSCSLCPLGKYGHTCQSSCGIGCKNHVCGIQWGSCTCRTTNFEGDKCDQCVNGKYSSNCDVECPAGCKTNICKINGNCYSCKNGFYGSFCERPCPTGCQNNICYINGACYSCKFGFSGSICDQCESGKYGTDCNSPCPKGCANNICKRNGECHSCISGFTGKFCNQCETGKYGTDCDISCSVGCKSNFCNSNGGCSNCKTGFTGTKCDYCIGSKYGNNCDKDCPITCTVCNSQTNCTACVQRHWGSFCQPCPPNCTNCSSNTMCMSCETGFYGQICNKQCSKNCRDGRCDEANGRCIIGCIDGFYDDKCNKKCNPNCAETSCGRKFGECLHGCKAGFQGPNCTRAVAQTQSDGGNKGVTIGASAGGAVFLVIIIVVIVVVLLLKKRNTRHTHEKKDATEVNDNTDNSVVTYSRIVTPSLHLEQNDADVVYAMPNKLKKNVDTVKSSNTDTPTKTVSNPNYEKPHAANDNTISNPNFENPTNNDTNVRKQTDSKPRIAAKPTSVYENAAARGSVAKNSTSMKAKQLDDSMLEIEEDIDNIARSSNDKSVAQPTTDSEVADTYYNVTAVKRRKIKLDQLPNCVSKKAKEDFIEEFQQLPPGLIKPYIDSQRKVNLSKNRYKGIYPYDETRVVLKEADSDYINASYIDGYNKRKAYIASIGPTYKYMGDMSAFWIMVWQEKVGKIVMLTKLDEGGAPKCDQYWPEKDFSLKYASIQVTCQSEESYADYTGRSFTLQKDSEKRKIVQVHFTAWPDKGTPDDVTSLIEFRQKVISTKTELEGPILVHCSAGIGRTGTYIALDSLTEEGEAEGEVDIYAFVRNMREQRVNMVQTAEQYQYLHNALVHTLTFDSKAVEASKFDKYMTSHTDDHLGEKFEKLQAFVEQSSDDEVDAVKRNQALRNKNRVGADIPGDRNRPKLYLERKLGSSDYINAVYVNSYTTINRYMVAQTPLPDTVVDFLTLIIQEKVACIVSMETDSVDDKTIGLYYPADNQTLKKGTFTVKSVRENDTEQYVIRKLEIVHKGKFGTEDVRIPHIQLTQWNENKNIPEEPAKFVQFVKDVEVKYGGNQSKGPILVHCLTGAEKSGLFCVVSNLLEKTQIDQETSVVNAVRQIKYRRHMSIPNKDQYTFCHQCVNEYLRTFDIYSNFELKT
ncbi:uncharacterized protein LOC123542313 isoform X3 [Mercenaria mercenaria]|uniref:uncharacterized protein LOC123542313 isoform X3 n=1 Tax=Mercenaria mercenaria TaxID=6596 RepID=UPI00234F4DE0|nr:uncharacterized protein LOC123542313 isoform X3 [Mercenaria mercenaria]